MISAAVVGLKAEEVADLLGVKPCTIYRWIRNREIGFPAPVRYSRKMSRWIEADVYRWIETMAGRRGMARKLAGINK